MNRVTRALLQSVSIALVLTSLAWAEPPQGKPPAPPPQPPPAPAPKPLSDAECIQLGGIIQAAAGCGLGRRCKTSTGTDCITQ
jgi:hypothetical protein